jgi:antitoxin Phd
MMPQTKTRTKDPRAQLPTRRHDWQLQTAKARFSEVFRLARTEGPQVITRQGKDAVVMIADEAYLELVGKTRHRKSLVAFLRASPLVGVNLDLSRARDEGREIKL